MRINMYLRRLATTGLIALAAGLTLTAGVAQADCVGIYCEGPTAAPVQQQQAAATQALTLAASISNPVAKAAVTNAVNLSNQLANQVNTLLLQAQTTKNPVVKAQLQRAALVEANAASALAQLARSFAAATLRAEGKKAADVAGAQAHAKPSAQTIQKQVSTYLTQAKGYANKANALLKQAARMLRGKPSKSTQQKANKLIAQAKADVAKAQALAAKAKKLAGK